MHLRSTFPLVISTIVLVAAGVGVVAQPAGPPGAATPQEAVAIVKKAGAAGDVRSMLGVVSPRGLKAIAGEGVTGVLMVLAFSDPDDPMPGAEPPKAELDARRKQYQQAVSVVTATLKPYGLESVIGKPGLADETQKTIAAAVEKADALTLVTQLFGAMVKIGPLLGIKDAPRPDAVLKLGTVTGYKVSGDRATAQNDAQTLDFVRSNGRWYIEPPSAPGTPPTAAEESRQAPAPSSVASGKEPEVVAAGVQVVRVVAPANDFSAKPFRADNGTTLVLWVKMPEGQGLIEIDERASVLRSFGDDKGTNMGGKFGSFPDEFEDASGGIIDIESTGFAAPDATALVAEGTIAMRVATGTRKTRAANVRIQNDAKFTFGQTPIVVADVEADEESVSFSLKLSRQVMTSIRNVVFLDAKGGTLEGRRTSTGYINDAGEMGFSVKTTARTLTLEFEAWQGLRTVTVPFTVRAGLGLR